MQQPGQDDAPAARRRWMAVLAKASVEALERVWKALEMRPAYEFLRQPETGLVMVRGRTGGTGAPFNMGEMTVTRCVVRLAGGGVGHAYVAGRRKRHAELAAVFDALLQDPARRAGIERLLIEPQAAEQTARRRVNAAKSATTRVEFFTMARGDNPEAGEGA